jgi:ATP-dependent metalloprotease
MGGHVAEKLIIGSDKISSGCGSDLQGATGLATYAVRQCGMYADLAGYNKVQNNEASEEYNALVDAAVKKILEESFERVSNLLTVKDKELRNLSRALYQHDYLDAVEMDLIIKGEGINKEKDEKKVRNWDTEKYGGAMIQF